MNADSKSVNFVLSDVQTRVRVPAGAFSYTPPRGTIVRESNTEPLRW